MSVSPYREDGERGGSNWWLMASNLFCLGVLGWIDEKNEGKERSCSCPQEIQRHPKDVEWKKGSIVDGGVARLVVKRGRRYRYIHGKRCAPYE